MTTGETFISILLIVIAYFLYQIAKQLSYLTGVKIKFPFSDTNQVLYKKFVTKRPPSQKKKDHLPN